MIKKYLSLLFILLIIYACATVQSPTGGQKDEKAPILYESNPKDQSKNFQGTEIKLFFNEWMKVDQLNKELIITPREEFEYEATLKKQELLIEFKKPLKDSTTYTFNFRNALKDITEGNLWENPVIAFSTGNFLDSLTVEGRVTKLMNQEPAKSFVVGLYDATSDTANLRQGKPVYFTTTNDKGYFLMQNIKAGQYLLYTFKDTNDNLINNSQSEPFGFYSDTLNLYDSLPSLELSTYNRNEDTLKLKKYSPVGKDFIVQYNKGLSDYKIINVQDSNQHIYANDVEQSKYIKIYKENFPELEYETDSIELYLEVTDSINQSRLDTIYFRLRESRITNDEIKIKKNPIGKINSGSQEFKYLLTKPVHTINYDSIQLRIDTIPVHTFEKEEITLNFNKKEITLKTIINEKEINSLIDSLKTISDSLINYQDSIRSLNDSTNAAADSSTTNKNTLSNTKEDRQKLQTTNGADQELANGISRATTNSTITIGNNQIPNSYALQIYIGHGAFMGIESDSTAKSTTKLSFKILENYGTIKGSVVNLNSNFIVELMSEDFKVQDTLINKNEYQFNYVEPGKYRLRIIEDSNGNKKWDPGNPLTLTPAEKIHYYDEVITVKANWEIIDKNFDFSVDKSVNEGADNGDL